MRDAIGVPALYAHQRAAWDAAARGEHLVVTTGTASGKTLAFNLPVLDALAREPKNRALYLYPTKALAQDQFRTLSGYGIPRLRPAIYDGDTPAEQRWQIRRCANVILSNPDMLHVGLLPHHDRWGDVLANLRYVVVDEAHVYRGVFGSHVGERAAAAAAARADLRRRPAVPARLGDDLEPRRARRRLLGAPVTVIGDDAAPRAERTVVLWNPPLLDEELGLRGSALAEAAKLQAGFVERGLRTLTFAKSRKAAELIHRFTAERLGDDSQLSPYRAGLHRAAAARDRAAARRGRPARRVGDERARARDRRRPARRGDLGRLPRHGRVAAPAVGPRGPARPRARGARRGRGRRSTSTSCASPTSCSAGASRRRCSTTRARASSPGTCARPRSRRRSTSATPRSSGPRRSRPRRHDAELRRTPAGFVWAGKDYPAARVGLRSAEPEAFSVVDAVDRRGARPRRALARVLDRARGRRLPAHGRVVPRARAGRDGDARGRRAVPRRLVHAGEEGDADRDRRAAARGAADRARPRLRRDRGDRAGRRLRAQDAQLAGAHRARAARRCRRRASRPRRSGSCPSRGSSDGLDAMPKLLGTLHAAEHALISMLPLWTMSDRWDIGGLSTNLHRQTGRPTVFVYDGHAGGIGITERGFEQFEGWVADTSRMVAGCPCVDGCPSCVQSPKCGNLNDMLDKAGAATFLARLVSAPR